MKLILLIVVVLAVIGGAVFAMMQFGIPPFKKPGQAAKKTGSVKPTVNPPSAQSAAAPSVEPPPLSPAASAHTTRKSEPSTAAQSAASPHEADPSSAAEAERKLARLASVYEQMPAEEAGRILAKLPDPLVEKLLRRIEERQVGKLLLTFDADRAARLTQALAR